MRPNSALILAAALLLGWACGGQTGLPNLASSANEGSDQGSGKGHGQDAGTPETDGGGTEDGSGDPGGSVPAPDGTFAQYFGEPDAVSTGCGVAGIADQHLANCAIYAMNGYTQIDVGLWSLAADARSLTAAHFWAWNVSPVAPSTQPVGPVWAGVAQAADGQVMVAATFGGDLEVDRIIHPAGVVGSFVGLISADGSSGQTRALGGSAGEVALAAITVATDGNVLVAGRYSGSQGFGAFSATSTDPHPFLMRLTVNLDPIGFTDFAAVGETGQVEALAPTPDGGALVGGTRGPVGQPAHPFLARVDSNGTLLWQKTFPGLLGSIRHLATDGDAWYASLDAVGSFTWGGRDVGLAAGGAALITGSGELDGWAKVSMVPLTALAAGSGRLVAIGGAQQAMQFGSESVGMPSGYPSVFLLGLEPGSGAIRWSRIYTSTQTPFAFTQAALLPSTRLLISGQQRVPTDFGIGWEPDDQGAPVGLWLVLSPLP